MAFKFLCFNRFIRRISCMKVLACFEFLISKAKSFSCTLFFSFLGGGAWDLHDQGGGA